MNPPVPLAYADVTADWMSAALQARWPGVRVSALRRGAVFGYKQNKFKAHLQYAAPRPADAPDSVVVKGNFPAEEDPSTGSAWAMATELRSLRDVVPLVTAPVMPQWHYIGVRDDASAIVMEDLTPTGASFFDAFTPLSLPQARAFIDAFARLHASSWNSAQFNPGGSMGPGSFAAENRRLVNDVYFPTFFQPAHWQSYVERPRGRALPLQFQDLARCATAWRRLWEELSGSAMVVVHGDEHLGNLYWSARGEPGVLDWVARPEHWPVGVAYFLLSCLDVADRRRWDEELLRWYLERLAAHGVPQPLSFEEAWRLYRCACFYPVVTWLNNSAVWQPEAINTANAVRAAMAALDHDTFGLLGV